MGTKMDPDIGAGNSGWREQATAGGRASDGGWRR